MRYRCYCIDFEYSVLSSFLLINTTIFITECELLSMAYISLQNMYHLSFTLLVSESNPNYLKENGNALNHTTGMLKSFAGFMYS